MAILNDLECFSIKREAPKEIKVLDISTNNSFFSLNARKNIVLEKEKRENLVFEQEEKLDLIKVFTFYSFYSSS